MYHPACRCHLPWQPRRVERRHDPPPWKRGGSDDAKGIVRNVLILPCITRTDVDTWKAELAMMTPLSLLPRVSISSRKAQTSKRSCLVSRTANEALREIDEGLLHSQAFWTKFKGNVKDLCLGSRGVSNRMQAINKASSVAFWLEDILLSPVPTAGHVRALVELYHLVKALVEIYFVRYSISYSP